MPKRGRITVDRNRLKRRLRELVRIYALPALAPVDLVILARAETYAASVAELHTELLDAVERSTRGLRTKGQTTRL